MLAYFQLFHRSKIIVADIFCRKQQFFLTTKISERWSDGEVKESHHSRTRATTMASKEKRSIAVSIERTRRGCQRLARLYHPLTFHSTHARDRHRKVRSASVSSRRSPPRPHPPRIVWEAQAPQPRRPRLIPRPTVLITPTRHATTRLRRAPTVRTTTRMMNFTTTRSEPGGTRQTTTPVQMNGTGS